VIKFSTVSFTNVCFILHQVLRMMKGYDDFNMILLPPRQPTDRLPQELLDYYDGLSLDTDSFFVTLLDRCFVLSSTGLCCIFCDVVLTECFLTF